MKKTGIELLREDERNGKFAPSQYWADRERVNKIFSLKSVLCGHCDKFMKCTCPREQWINTPTISDAGCTQFERNMFTQSEIDRLQREGEK